MVTSISQDNAFIGMRVYLTRDANLLFGNSKNLLLKEVSKYHQYGIITDKGDIGVNVEWYDAKDQKIHIYNNSMTIFYYRKEHIYFIPKDQVSDYNIENIVNNLEKLEKRYER